MKFVGIALLAVGPVCFAVCICFTYRQHEQSGVPRNCVAWNLGGQTFYTPKGGGPVEERRRRPLTGEQYRLWEENGAWASRCGAPGVLCWLAGVMILLLLPKSGPSSEPPPPPFAVKFNGFVQRYCVGWPVVVAVLTTFAGTGLANRLGEAFAVRVMYGRVAWEGGLRVADPDFKELSDGSQMSLGSQMVAHVVAVALLFVNLFSWFFGLGYVRLRRSRARPSPGAAAQPVDGGPARA